MSKNMKQLLAFLLVAILFVSSIFVHSSNVNANFSSQELQMSEEQANDETVKFSIVGQCKDSSDSEEIKQLQEEMNQSTFFATSTPIRDVTANIKHETQIWLNGKKYDKTPVKVSVGDNFAYEYKWSPNFSQDDFLKDGDYFEKVLFKVPHLNLPTNISQKLVIQGIHVGDWTLTYQASSGELKYVVKFNRYIELFDMNTIQAQLQGSGVFTQKGSGNETIEWDGFQGTLEIIDRPTTPPIPPTVSGQGWQPPQIPSFPNDILSVGKGVRWQNSDQMHQKPQIEWRVGFLEQLQKKQQAYLTNGVSELVPLNGNCIIEETLDANMEFLFDVHDNNPDQRFKKAPFHLELPVIVPGTSLSLNGVIQNPSYNGFGRISPFITAESFTFIDGEKAYTKQEIQKIQSQVKSTPLSWTITKDPTSHRQTLLINLGVLGGNDPSKGITWNHARGDLRWPQQGVQSKIDECTNIINKLESGTNSPIANLDQKHQEVVNVLLKALQLPTNNQYSDTVQKWRESYRTWRSRDDVGYLKPLSNLTEQEFPNVTLLQELKQMNIHTNGTKLQDSKQFKDFELAYNNIKNDQEVYLKNRTTYRTSWQEAKKRYEQTLEFYKDGRIYGFTLNCRTTSINTSVERYTNNVRFTMNDQNWSAQHDANVQFSNRISGSFALGSLVVYKGNHCYDQIDPNKEEQAQQHENITQLRKDKAGIAGAKFSVYRGASDGSFVKDPQYLVKFLDKSASPNHDTYTYKAGKGTITELETDQEGKLVLAGLAENRVHYLVETSAPKGYYQDETPIKFTIASNKVLYRLVGNVARSIRLYKQDSFSKHPLANVEFALYKDGQQVKGFRKQSIRGKQVLVPDAQGSEKLLTNEQGMLCIHNLEAGNYKIKEITPAPGYLLEASPKEYSFTLDTQLEEGKGTFDQDHHFLINQGNAIGNDPKTTQFDLTKVDGNTVDQPLANAKFAIFRFMGSEEEFKKNPNAHDQWQPISFSNNALYYHTKQKVEQMRHPLILNGTQDFDVIVSDADGKISVSKLPIGHYALAEFVSPTGYHRDENNYYFDITSETIKNPIKLYQGMGTERKEVKNNQFKNDQRLAQVKLVKSDADDMPLISGTKVKNGYLYDGSSVTGGTLLDGAVFKLFRRQGSGGINPNKEELKSETILGNTIGEHGEKYDTCIGVGTTKNGILELKDMKDQNGKAIAGLHMDRYYFMEIKAPQGYRLNQTPIMFTIDQRVYPNDLSKTPGLLVSVPNTKYVTALKVIKKDQTSKLPLVNVGFSIYKDGKALSVSKSSIQGRYRLDPTSKETIMHTNNDGSIFVSGLEANTTYTFKEVQPLPGYVVMNDFTMKTPTSIQDGKVLSGYIYNEKEVENTRMLGQVKLHKQDEEDATALEGAIFELYRVEQQESQTKEILVNTQTTDSNGNIVFDKLTWGEYFIKEKQAPKGYVIDKTPLRFTIDQDDLVEDDMLTVSFPHVSNSKKVGKVTVLKVDKFNETIVLKDATFTLQRKVKDIWVPYSSQTYVTDEFGQFQMKLPPGTYKLTEIKAPLGYQLPLNQEGETIFTVEDHVDGNAPKPIQVKITNKKEKIPPTGIEQHSKNNMVLITVGLITMVVWFIVIGISRKMKQS